MTPIKVCSCGKEFFSLPSDAKRFDDTDMGGWYFTCSCHSTNYVPFADLMAQARNAGHALTGQLLAFLVCAAISLAALYLSQLANLGDTGTTTKEGSP